MEEELESWELTDFNIDGHIALSQKFGQLKMMRSDDGLLILAEYANYGRIDQEKDTPTTCFDPDSTLGFVLDIGIQKKKRLTVGHGFYFGTKMIDSQSNRKVSQKHFNKELFEKIGDAINNYYQSGDPTKEKESIKMQLLIDQYNKARLLFPNFYAESYLSLMRIIDALGVGRGRYDFATFTAKISPSLNKDIFDKLKAVASYSDRLKKAEDLFNISLKEAKDKSFSCYKDMSSLDEAGRMVFACFYSAYMYRNEFTHQGFPFPDSVKDAHGIETDAGTSYISPVLGISRSRFNRPNSELQKDDLIDIHEIVGEAKDFKDTYFLLIPTWHFLKCLTRQAILEKIDTFK